jgi:hypothetical protein
LGIGVGRGTVNLTILAPAPDDDRTGSVPAPLIDAEPEPIAVDLERMIAEAYPDFSLRGAAKLNIHSSSSRRREIVSVTAKFAIASRGKMRHVK